MTNTRAICLTISTDVHLICKNLIKVLFIKKYLGQFIYFFFKYPKGVFQLGIKCQKTLSDSPPLPSLIKAAGFDIIKKKPPKPQQYLQAFALQV